jgi:hypothetical protein
MKIYPEKVTMMRMILPSVAMHNYAPLRLIETEQ